MRAAANDYIKANPLGATIPTVKVAFEPLWKQPEYSALLDVYKRQVLMSPVSMLMIHNPMTVAMGDTAEMQKAIEMLGSVKDSIINAYEIKTGLSRAKLSHLMDAETWMDATKAMELGFADEIMTRSDSSEDVEPPAVSMLYSKANVINSLMDKIAAKCAIDVYKRQERIRGAYRGDPAGQGGGG